MDNFNFLRLLLNLSINFFFKQIFFLFFLLLYLFLEEAHIQVCFFSRFTLSFLLVFHLRELFDNVSHFLFVRVLLFMVKFVGLLLFFLSHLLLLLFKPILILMERFQELLTEAAQLKQSQLKNERKNYQSLPDYLKAGLNYAKRYQVLRKQDYTIQMTMSERFKKEGNSFFKKQCYDEALAKYEQALAIFRYIDSKSYDNMKDEDLEYVTYVLPQIQMKYLEQYQTHLAALYLNICSCLTKKNRKEDAIHSADEGLKIRQTAKAYYKKAQAYLQYINKEPSDIKLGFYYLNKCYEISKDPSVIQEMHKIKREIDEERDKQKKWFKFMFDKNSQNKEQESLHSKPAIIQRKQIKQETVTLNQNLKKLQLEQGDNQQRQDEKLQKTKQKLSKFTNLSLSEEQWLQSYEGEFIAKHGSKIYSIIQLYGYTDLLGQYRALLALSLQLRKEKEGDSVRRREAYQKYFTWLKGHPIDKITKYTERYELQTKWIRECRLKRLPTKQELEGNKAKSKISNAFKKQKVQQKQEILQVIGPQNQAIKMAVKEHSKQVKPIKEEQISTDPSVSQLLNEISKIPQAKVEVQPVLQDIKSREQYQQVNGQAQSTQNSKLKFFSFLIALVIIISLRFIF